MDRMKEHLKGGDLGLRTAPVSFHCIPRRFHGIPQAASVPVSVLSADDIVTAISMHDQHEERGVLLASLLLPPL